MTTADGRAEEVAENKPIDILLVESNPGDTRLFTESFKEASITNRIYAVSDGESALDFVHQRGEYTNVPRPDIVLLDPQLPGTSGTDVLSELNDEPELRDISVVILTSSDEEEDIVKSHGLDADTYIQKPVATEEFVGFVQSVEDFWFTIVRRDADE
ncbi:response regulator [Halomontanus rarus]|uniref:response regulator n=1 Tax=Halomontanus rarus TaxID=3034020 RepID=UPI0023E7AACC|nr:response regulator [Halovivax sp. TS33]